MCSIASATSVEQQIAAMLEVYFHLDRIIRQVPRLATPLMQFSPCWTIWRTPTLRPNKLPTSRTQPTRKLVKPLSQSSPRLSPSTSKFSTTPSPTELSSSKNSRTPRLTWLGTRPELRKLRENLIHSLITNATATNSSLDHCVSTKRPLKPSDIWNKMSTDTS